MKRTGKIGILMAALVVLIVGTVVLLKNSGDATVTEEDTSVTVFSLGEDSLVSLSWEYEGETLTFQKDGDSWVYAEDEAFPLSDSALDVMLSALAEVKATKTIENPESLSEYGLLEPKCTITVTEETETTILLGDETGMGGSRYFSMGDGNVYLVDSTILDDFSYGLYDLVSVDSIPDMSELKSFVLESGNKSWCITYQENSGLSYSDSYVWFLADEDSNTTLDTELTEEFIANITALSWNECVDYQGGDKLAEYGLDAPAATVNLTYVETTSQAANETDEDGNTVYETVETEKTFCLELGDQADSGCYARIADSDMIYLVDSAILDTLCYTALEELLPDDILLLDEEKFLSAEVTLDGETYVITRETREAEVEAEDSTEEPELVEESYYALDGTEIAFQNVLSDLLAMTSTGSVVGAEPERQEISFVFHVDSETYPEITLSFWQYNSTDCLVTLNGETRLLTGRDAVVTLAEGFQTLILE